MDRRRRAGPRTLEKGAIYKRKKISQKETEWVTSLRQQRQQDAGWGSTRKGVPTTAFLGRVFQTQPLHSSFHIGPDHQAMSQPLPVETSPLPPAPFLSHLGDLRGRPQRPWLPLQLHAPTSGPSSPPSLLLSLLAVGAWIGCSGKTLSDHLREG